MAETAEVKVPKRILNLLLNSLGAGVVPRIGAPYIAIGRGEEIASLLDNLDAVADGGAACRFLIGRYGSGKSFLIQLVRGYALDRGFLTADADLSPERRLTGGTGGGLATYKELLIHLSSKAAPDGGALSTVLSRFLVTVKTELAEHGVFPESEGFAEAVRKKVFAAFSELEGDVGGYDFARVLYGYFEAAAEENNDKMSACIRWLRGEYATKTEAKAALGFSVGTVISDENWYDYLKLLAALSVKIGYKGLAVFIDECVNLYKIPNRLSREANYEKILSIFNDTLQGKAKNLAVIFGGTPQFLEDTRRGLFSYEALKSRLEDSKYSALGYRTLSTPVIRLRRLSDNELLALVKRISNLFTESRALSQPLLTEEQITAFLTVELSRAGAEELVTPREIIRDFLTVLNILAENPAADFTALIRGFAEGEKTGAPIPAAESNKPKEKINIFDIEI